jgi:hypothetical protein
MIPIKSNDPRKRQIMEALKKKSGANRVTCVHESSNSDFFEGSCLKGNRSGYENLGTFSVTKEEIGAWAFEPYEDDAVETWDSEHGLGRWMEDE